MGILKTLFLGSLLVLTGCSSVTYVRVSDYAVDTPTTARHVEVFFQNAPRKARPIAIVAVARQGENAVYAVEKLREEAAALGADAITELDLSYTSGLFPNLQVTGLAVKYE